MPRLAHRIARALLILVIACWLPSARAAAPPGDLVRPELIAEPAAVAPGQPFWVGLRLRVKEGWHVYWRNPGDSGEAIAIAWQLPPGYAAGPIVWPTPSRIPIAHLVNFGYVGEAVLLVRIVPPAAVAAGALVDIRADATWLVCEKECIPGGASVALRLPVAATGVAAMPDPRMRATFEAARARLPQPSPWPASLEVGPDRLTLSLPTSGLKPETIGSAYYFPHADTLVRHAAPQQIEATRDGLTLRLERSALSVTPPTDAGGVLVVEQVSGGGTTRQAFELGNVRIAAASASAPPTASLAAILQAVVLALLGGLVLNLMPCVFPVLSIKVLALIGHSGGSRQRVRQHGLAYTGGVLAAFAVLGVLLLGLRAAGTEVGWGFQLQSPLAVALLAYVLFAVGLSLSGVFYVGASLQAVGGGAMRRPGLGGSFATGVLAAVVATPCTAPFMATAVGFALTQPAAVALAVMLALGLGLALPFLVLTLAPDLVSRLPRPGAWMDTLKQVLAFPVYATVAWLVWVLGQQVAPSGLFAALIGLVLVALAAWAFNLAQTASLWGRRTALATVAAALIGLVAALAELDRAGPAGAAQTASAAGYEPFTRQRLADLLAADRPVFVNMTAAWCITCLVNEHAALSSAAVKAAFASRNIAYLKGDWTKRDPEITRVLERHGRSGVPLYLLYAGGAEPIVLPQILTPAIVLGELDRIPGEPRRRASLATAKE
jgi:thiol:disulfide interchange protein/DsbC/DsbD-like thiol-disulfide interchange protein